MSRRPTRVAGIDPGTVSFDVCVLTGEEVSVDRSFPTAEVVGDPEGFAGFLQEEGRLDLVVGPSGYGLPWVSGADVGAEDIRLMTLAASVGGAGVGDPGGSSAVGSGVVPGMDRLIEVLCAGGLPLIFCPGVIHLNSVPAHRKVNRIDMGTADKLCAVVLGVWDQARRFGISYAQTSFVYLELGGAFTALVVVEEGRIVDGLGGTSGPLGYRAAGALDGEVAALIGPGKDDLGTGGVAWVAGRPAALPAELLESDDPRAVLGWEAFFEGLAVAVAGRLAYAEPREILLSGRLSRLPALRDELTRRLEGLAPVRRVEGFASEAKEAAQGAALIAQELVERRDGAVAKAGLLDAMDLLEAEGCVLDHLYVDGARSLRKLYGMVEGSAPGRRR
ncbi:MAG: DUF1464 family protein [Thermoleophilia bacterium]